MISRHIVSAERIRSESFPARRVPRSRRRLTRRGKIQHALQALRPDEFLRERTGTFASAT